MSNAVSFDLVQREDACRQQRPRFQLAQLLMPIAHLHRSRFLLVLLANPCRRQISTPRIDRLAFLLSRDVRMDAEVLSRGETETEEGFVEAFAIASILHQTLELSESFLDLGYRS